MKLKIIYVLSIFLFCSQNIFSQKNTEKITKYIEIGNDYLNKNLDTSLLYYQQAYKLNQKNNDRKLQAEILGNIGKVYHFQDSISKAIEFYQKSLDISVEINYLKQAVKILNNLGLLYFYTQNYIKAIETYKKQLKYSIELNDSLSISDAYNNFGSYYLGLDMLDSASYYYDIGLEIAQKINFAENIASISSNLALVYHTKGNLQLALKYYIETANMFEKQENWRNLAIIMGNIGALYIDNYEYSSALPYISKALAISDTISIEEYFKTTFLINIGIVYLHNKDFEQADNNLKKALKLSQKNDDTRNEVNIWLNYAAMNLEQKNFYEALKNAQKSLVLAQNIEADQLIASCYKYIGSAYNGIGNYTQAIENLNIAYNKSLKGQYLNYICDILDELKKSYIGIDDYPNALKTSQLYIQFKDSLSNIEIKKQIANMRELYETEKKQQEIERQNLVISQQKALNQAKDLKIKQSRTIIFSIIAVLTLILALLIVVYNSFREKKKANALLSEQKQIIQLKNEELKQLIEEITTQKEEIQRQKDIETEQKAEIIASITYAQKIQQAVLPSNEYISEILPQSFVLFKPRDIVSGDFYWFKKFNDVVFVVAADCTGHGVPGAFMSMLGMATLNDIVTIELANYPHQILEELRSVIKKSLKQVGKQQEQKDGMDIAFYSLNTSNNKIYYSGAYNPIYIVRNQSNIVIEDTKNFKTYTNENFPDKTMIEIKADRQPISVHIVEKDFSFVEFQLEQDDLVYSFSDGYKDQFGGTENEKINSPNFRNLLFEISNKELVFQKNYLNHYFDKWKGENKQVDDVLVIGVRITSKN